MAGNRVNLTFNMSDGEERSASFVLPEAEQKLQSDIYDRTKGVGAIPGSFGYGSDLVGIDTVYFNNKAEFLTWVHNTPSGRYLVGQRYGSEPVINSDVTFSGILEVIPTTSVGDEQYLPNVEKDIIFYGVNLGDIWYTRFTTQPNRLEAWRCLDKTKDITNLQNSLNSKASLYSPSFSGTPTTPTPSDDAVGLEIANAAFVRKLISALVDSSPEALDTLNELAQILYGSDTASWRSPLTGGLTLAAYLPENDGGSVSLLRGQGVQGSRLRQVVFEAEYRSSGFSATPRSFVYGNTLSGTYVALSGGPDVTFTKGIVSLFVRIA